ncbi:condensation domain-containing protein [Dactylosporangium fulvum]|uniref:Condensation domain-containing protein n=1 Tax=Dactylosporangium fulvum TaxID=53359 RepID=A0ABY5VS59_9ACTN|nr:condensation domain-containing protein [Dactylosporangium fulvum]UWP78656.1 condensation domain-containing protein [Dactylosporangium fulvum]
MDTEFAFTGLRSGAGPATWGQSAIWDVVRHLGTDSARYNVSGGCPLPEPLPVARVAEIVRVLLARHDSLHTRLEFDGSALRQAVVGSGAVPAVVRSSPEVLPAAYDLYHELQAEPFDPLSELPLRVGLVTSGGLVRYAVFSLSHTASDGWGLRNLLADFSALLAGRPLGEVPLQPLEEAGFQTSERGRRRDAAARRSWLAKLDRGPRRQFPVRAPAAPTFPNAVLNSPALALAMDRVAAGLAVNPAAVLLAAAAAAACRLTGVRDAVFQVVVNNRFLPGLAGGVNAVAQEGLFHLAGTHEPFPGLVRRTFGAALSAQRHAYYDKLALDRDIASIRACDHSCFVNDTRGLMPILGYTKPAPAPLSEARSRTTLTWPVEHEPRRNTTFALDAQDAEGSLELAMTADSALIPRQDMARFLYGIEELVVDQALALGAD